MGRFKNFNQLVVHICHHQIQAKDGGKNHHEKAFLEKFSPQQSSIFITVLAKRQTGPEYQMLVTLLRKVQYKAMFMGD